MESTYPIAEGVLQRGGRMERELLFASRNCCWLCGTALFHIAASSLHTLMFQRSLSSLLPSIRHSDSQRPTCFYTTGKGRQAYRSVAQCFDR